MGTIRRQASVPLFSTAMPAYPAVSTKQGDSGPRGSCRSSLEGTMSLEGLIVFLIIGLIAGWLAGQVMKGGGFGLVGDIVVGVIGAFIGGFLLPRIGLNLGGGFIAEVISALIGAIILLFILRLVKR